MSMIEDITEQNPWWSGSPPEIGDAVERDIFRKLREKMHEKGVLALVGLRRSGKTTLMKQLIGSLMETGVEARNILYFSFDMPKDGVGDVLKAYFNEIRLSHPSERETYVFLDEVQNRADWSSVVKSYYDRGYPVKFIVSGSSSFNILRGAGESLVGRIHIERVHPFSFEEFMRYDGLSVLDTDSVPAEHGKLLLEFRKYMKMGSFPEAYGKNIKEYLSTMTDLIFFRDIISILDVKRPGLLKDLFYGILQQSGNPINYSNLSRDTGAKYETILSYLDYLEMGFLIERSPLFPARTGQKKKRYKVYAGDHSFLNLVDVPDGRVLETAVFNNLRRFHDINHWHNSGEVDLILREKNGPVPVEISISEEKNPRHLLYFMEKYGVKTGYILGMDEFERRSYGEKEVIRMPAYLFILKHSHSYP